MSDQRLRAMGRKPDGAPAAISGDPPPEWSYHVGEAARSLPAAAAFGERVMQLPPAWREMALADAQQRRVDWFGDWSGIVRGVIEQIDAGAARPRGVATAIAMLNDRTISALEAGVSTNGRAFAPVAVGTATVAVTDRAIFHALRDAKVAGRPGLRGEFADALSNLPDWVASADATLWDSASSTPALVFAKRSGAAYTVLIVRPNIVEARASDPVRANWVRTIERRSRDDLRPMMLLDGSL